MIGHCDCNNFYVSCFRVFMPQLRGRPVGVLSSNDGCLVARSNELKALGVPNGMPAFQLSPEVRRQTVLLSSAYALFGEMSRRVVATMQAHTGPVQVYSIDEQFIDLSGLSTEALQGHAAELRQEVQRSTGIPVSIGVAPSRTLAKVATGIAKKQPVFKGVCVLEADHPATLAHLDRMHVTDLWGVARRTGEKLERMRIRTALDLRKAEPKEIRKRFGIVLERTVWELRGVDVIRLDDIDQKRQNIMTSRTFGKATGNLDDLREAVRSHAQAGAEKVRRQQSVARAIMVFLSTPRFRSDLPQDYPSLTLPLPMPTDDSRVIVGAAQRALEMIYRRGYQYAKAGVMMIDLTDRDGLQLDMLDTQETEERRQRSAKLMGVMDALNREFGRGAVTLGGVRKDERWRQRNTRQTPRFLTSWKELPEIRMG
ncbi:Y-family DNA polymerase [Modicisalibacter xianhensis]|uniref:DNA polymerase V n=1 Tax=Modicisalibacter xianhensis TaxID=442341 RepID=A0A1I3FR03_9GAMM|nr:Y-family DNA polymerase [Halomonas xianhensis]SFI13663.1 DNA polymerase V [Halomonas xianhensis]